MKKLCLVYGGDSLERDISILTSLKIQKELDKFAYDYLMVYLDQEGNFYTGEALLDKNNYAYKKNFKKGCFLRKNNKNYFKTNLKKEEFDLVLLLMHGYGSEDGTVGGFFDTLKIPCIYPGLIQSALLQDKANFKRVMSSLNIKQTNYEILTYYDFQLCLNQKKKITKLLFPLIVKPSHLGSSIGIRKVNSETELINALYEAYQYDEVAIIEETILNLKEVNVAVVRKDNELFASNVERVNDKDKVLSFMDKYDNYSLSESHIIPADIEKNLIKKVISTSKKVYSKLLLNSVVRFDYLLDEKTKELYLNEINAIPGSLSYYLFSSLGIDTCDLIDILIKDYENLQIEKNRKIKVFGENFLSILKEK